jgi:hypothetical protein
MLKARCLASFPCLPRHNNWEVIQNPKMAQVLETKKIVKQQYSM